MRHPALRRSARHTSRREARADSLKSAMSPADETSATPDAAKEHSPSDPAGQNRPAPGAPPDGDHNQGGVRKEGIDYQRDLGSEQDA
ncbi:hypothetical protein ASG35_01930 [Burkholderia sp. Leaf177]|uniref:hypothetical protein n=1 Tax=Burkholderia sp. Leaf177 TaxID=1736287 RepID=UPI0006F3C7D6|nr:hypothetical protein [Burkholderia sp. Leaf177]KQR90013.1 hypothetical protein ASG35_01930 [Burkholderia sp. Leaf177]